MVKQRPTSNFQPPRNAEATLGVGNWELGVREAYAACERAARAHYENFPVASILLPRRMRPHVAAVYAFARAADDFADEGAAARCGGIRIRSRRRRFRGRRQPAGAREAAVDRWMGTAPARSGGIAAAWTSSSRRRATRDPGGVRGAWRIHTVAVAAREAL